MSLIEHVVVVGAGHAGGRVVQNLRELGFAGKVTLIGDEKHAPYERPALSKELLLDSGDENITLGPEEFWEQSDLYERIIARVERVHSGAKRLTLDNGQDLEFDTLVLATGGQARELAVLGAELPRVHTLRTIDDSLAIKAALSKSRHMVVIGAGVIGMEVAASARVRGVQVTVLEHGDRILARCLPEPASKWLHALHEDKGVAIHTGCSVQVIEQNDAGTELSISAVDKLGETHTFTADLALMAVGIDCQLDYLDGSGVEVNNGVVVDAFCRSPSMPWVYAVGDVAHTPNELVGFALRLETWRNAENQARAVAEFICNERSEPYVEVPWMWTDQYDHNIQVIGIPNDQNQIVVRGDFHEGSGSLIWLRDEVVVGGVLLNNARDRRPLEELVKRGLRVDLAFLQDAGCQLRTLL
ncbi:NAD(P)/FAD-dependent oxidoreductase [Paenalcaligenes hominis]|uniref:NAD(P)/FAD-dependent oxidoreductase n=1 Tax=Paenalcaligenes hominis TaxID=643674 RepID=UPI003523D450